MKELWSKRWKKALIWVSAYISFIAFAIVGGYTIVKCNDDELKATSKLAFIVTLIFTAVSAFITILQSVITAATSSASLAFSIIGFIYAIAELAVYAVFVCLALFGEDGGKPNGPSRDE